MINSIEVAGAKLEFSDTGSPSPNAPMLLLVHGFPLSRAMWSAQVKALAQEFRIVAPDLRGYGGSTIGDWPTDEHTVSLRRYAEDLVAILDYLQHDGPVVLVGFSMGGYIALAMEREWPDHFGALALLDTRAAADSEESRATRLKMADKIHEWGAARVAELMRPNLFAAGTPEAIVEQTVQLIGSTQPASIAASQRAMAARPDSTSRLPAINKPTLVLVGQSDAISPPGEMQTMAQSIPGAQYVEIAGAGHMAPVENSAAVNAALKEFASGLS